jgi:molybdate transport system ATP-binding protein
MAKKWSLTVAVNAESMPQIRIVHFCHAGLRIENLTINSDESWTIFGTNDSGIDILSELFQGNLQHYSAEILELPQYPGIVTFTGQQTLFEEELRNDDSDFLGSIDPGTLVREFLPNYHHHLQLLTALDMERCLELGYRQLSSGQARKMLLLREIQRGAKTLILQNPYDGLDRSSCRELNDTLSTLSQNSITVIILVNVRADIPSWCSHLAMIDKGRLKKCGRLRQLLPLLKTPEIAGLQNPAPVVPANCGKPEELVSLQQGFAGYGSKVLFTGLELLIAPGDHTLITGPNGCGKSTLLEIITGDNPQCYANNLRIFGRKRGSGESIWEIKKKMGIVSPSLHRDHRSVGTTLHVVLSGFFDSIGLYEQVSRSQIDIAKKWLAWIDLGDKETTPFRQLSFAGQRLVLITRALVQCPLLLILDEPTQGLDDYNREKLLQFLEKVARENISTILFVSHREDEMRSFFSHHIRLDSYAPSNHK